MKKNLPRLDGAQDGAGCSLMHTLSYGHKACSDSVAKLESSLKWTLQLSGLLERDQSESRK